MGDVSTVSTGMSDGECDSVDQLIIDISQIKARVSELRGHRNYSVAMTKLDEARMWLRDRGFQPASLPGQTR